MIPTVTCLLHDLINDQSIKLIIKLHISILNLVQGPGTASCKDVSKLVLIINYCVTVWCMDVNHSIARSLRANVGDVATS